jgi:hypothetical protein
VSATGEAKRDAGNVTQAEASNRSPRVRDAASSADWRDDIISAAREHWQSSPSWPGNPALHRSPDARQPEPGIEAGE